MVPECFDRYDFDYSKLRYGPVPRVLPVLFLSEYSTHVFIGNDADAGLGG